MSTALTLRIVRPVTNNLIVGEMPVDPIRRNPLTRAVSNNRSTAGGFPAPHDGPDWSSLRCDKRALAIRGRDGWDRRGEGWKATANTHAANEPDELDGEAARRRIRPVNGPIVFEHASASQERDLRRLPPVHPELLPLERLPSGRSPSMVIFPERRRRLHLGRWPTTNRSFG